MRKIFINEFGRLRSGWRLVLFFLAFFAIFFLMTTVLRIAYVVLDDFGPAKPYANFAANAIFHLSLLISGLGAGFICARWLEGLPWRSLGLTFHHGWLRDLLIGCAIGFASLAVAVGVAMAGGGFRFSFNRSDIIGPLLLSFFGSLLGLFPAALAEEAIFRGYPLQTFARARLAWLGLIVTSLLFAAVHLTNPNVAVLGTLGNTALAGVWLAVAYLRTRSLWFATGLHWIWNWALGWFFGLPVSGLSLFSNTFLQAQDLGPSWLTGGSYGIEGGVAGTVALVVFTLFIWRTPWVSATPEMKKLSSEENPVVPSPVLSRRPADDAV